MLLAEIRQKIIKYAMSRSVVTDENNINYGQLDSDIITSAAALKLNMILSNKPLSSSNYLTTTIEYDPQIQENPSKYRDYAVPLAVNGRYNYIGSPELNGNISVVNSVAEYSDTIKCQIPERVRAFIAYQGLLRITSGIVKDITINFVPINPKDCADWNENYDQFPLEEGMCMSVIETLGQAFYKYVMGQPIDTKSDSIETTKKIS
jgi:hypothetical protein